MLLSLALLIVAAEPVAADKDFRFVTGLAASAFSMQPDVFVLTSDDLRRAMAIEADKQALGCENDESCLAEIAAAMDARLVVSGTVDDLGDELLLQLNVFDAKSAVSIGRVTARGRSAREIASIAEERSATLAAATRARLTGPLRVIILDVDLRRQQAAAPTPLPWAWIGAGGLLVTGLAALAVGGVADQRSVAIFDEANAGTSLTAKEAASRYDESDGWATVSGISYVVGAVAVAGGVAAATVAVVGE